MICWLLHQGWRTVLIPSGLPFQIGDVVFCEVCVKPGRDSLAYCA